MTSLILLSVLSLLHADPQPATTSAPAPVPAASPAAQPAAAQVTLRVTVRKEGQPFAGIPLAAAVDSRTFDAFAATNSVGVANLPVSPHGTRICRVVLQLGNWPASAGPRPSVLFEGAELEALLAPWTFGLAYMTVLPPGATTDELAIDVYANRSVSVPIQINGQVAKAGRAMLGWRPPTANHDVRLGLRGLQLIGADGVLRINVAPRNFASFAYVLAVLEPATNNIVYHRLEIPAGEPNGTLPTVNFDANDGPKGAVDLTVSNIANAPMTMFGSALDAGSFVSADGSKVIDALFGRDADRHFAWPCNVKLPVGTWYFVPGIFLCSHTQLRLIERLRAGEDLTSTPIPKIVITEGATVAVNADAAAIERAIMGFPEPAPAVPPAPPPPPPANPGG